MKALITGLLLLASLSFAQDPELVKKAEQGDAEAQFMLGILYAHGKGVPQNDAEAFKWYKLSADQGHAAAQNNLGGLYLFGSGVGKDNAKALELFKKACDNGNNAGCSSYDMNNRSSLRK